MQAFQFAEGVMVVALGGIDAALEAGENVAVLLEDQAEADIEDVHGIFPELSLDGAAAAEEPFAIDEAVDEEALDGAVGTEAAVILGGEFVEGGLVFAADELGLGIDTGFERVPGGAGLALVGARAGRFLRVEAIGVNLFLGWHRGRG